MFAKQIDEYRGLSEKTRFPSQLAAFTVSLFSILSLYNLIWWFNIEEFPSLAEFLSVYRMPAAILFQTTIAIIFALRFSLFFFKTEKLFWLRQVFLMVGLALIFSYWMFSRPADNELFRMYSTYTEIFRLASRSFEFVAWMFMILSPIKEFSYLVVALIKSR